MSDVARRVEIGDRIRTATRRALTWRAFAAYLVALVVLHLLNVPHTDTVMYGIWVAALVLGPVGVLTSDVLTRPEGEVAWRVLWRESRALLGLLVIVGLFLAAGIFWR